MRVGVAQRIPPLCFIRSSRFHFVCVHSLFLMWSSWPYDTEIMGHLSVTLLCLHQIGTLTARGQQMTEMVIFEETLIWRGWDSSQRASLMRVYPSKGTSVSSCG